MPESGTPAPMRRGLTFSTGNPSPVRGRLTDHKRTTHESWTLNFTESLSRWLTEYALEWRNTDAALLRAAERRVACIEEAVNYDDGALGNNGLRQPRVVLFVKPGGLCPFCNLASKILLEAHASASTGESSEMPMFSLQIADLLHEDRDALRIALGVSILTWPVIFINGAHLQGGGEAIARLHKGEDGGLCAALSAPRVAFAPPRPLQVPTQPRPLLLHQAGGGPWLGCQQRIYGNVLRGIALLQICLLAPAHELDRNGHYQAALPMLGLLCLDSLLFTLFGPTPFTPLGNLVSLVVWRRRGTVAPLLPYKVTFLGLYFLANLGGILCRVAQCNAGDCYGGDTSTFCQVIASDGIIYTMLTNSALLAIFRF